MVNDRSSKRRFAPRKDRLTKEIWSLGHRANYANRLKIASIADPKGPHSLDDICAQTLPYSDRSENWKAPHLDELRELALSYWVGSEFDIALVRKEAGHEIQRPLTRIIHKFNALTNKGLQLQHGFSWMEYWSCHIAMGNLDYIELISYLLSYYQAVFFDDTIAQKSRIYYHSNVVRNMPSKIKICRDVGGSIRYLKKDRQLHSLVQPIRKVS